MICLQTVKRFCKEYWKVENYDQAMADESQTWHCHHRYEIDYNLSKLELQALGFYFNRPFDELIFLTPEEHISLHKAGENHHMYGKEGTFKGKHHTEESKAKMRVAKEGKYEGENNPNYKYHITEEELYDLYIVQGLSRKQIKELYGCSSTSIQLKLKKFNIRKK